MSKLNIQFREPSEIMKLSRLGSFHQSKLSFLRSFIREFKDWNYKRNIFDLDKNGYGTAVYSLEKNQKSYSLVCFAQYINPWASQLMPSSNLIVIRIGFKTVLFYLLDLLRRLLFKPIKVRLANWMGRSKERQKN